MALAAPEKVVLGSIAFGFFWVLAVFPAVPFLPVGRTAGSLLGALLMVVFRVISPDDAYAAIDLPILGLLFGTMVVSVFLEKADMFKYLGKLLAWKSRGGKDLLCRVCVVSAISSAFFTNDTSCVVLTEFVLKLARQNNLPPQPFLLALASSSNIGSAATPIGNPQNLVIAVQSGISFGKFLSGIVAAMLVGVVVNAAMLLCFFWKVLSVEKDEEIASTVGEVVADEGMVSHRFSPATMSHAASMDSQEFSTTLDALGHSVVINGDLAQPNNLRVRVTSNENDTQHGSAGEAEEIPRNEEADFSSKSARIHSFEGKSPSSEAPTQALDQKKKSRQALKRLCWKTCVYLVTLGMLVALLMGLDMSWTAIAAALALVVLDFKDARPCLEKVSYSLLVFFCGMFITVDGFNRTGIPSAFWDFVEPYSRIDSMKGVALLSLVILVLSNVASNVPTVLLLGGRVAASAAMISQAQEVRAWLILAWVSTVAGNLSLLGSAANLIVCEQARKAQFYGYNLSFFSHLRFGLPSTLIVTTIGLFLIRT